MLRQRYGEDVKDITLMNTFRKLWEQHIMWTRTFIISTAAELNDLDLVTKRLLRNPGDFAKVLERYYGRQKADEFQALLEDHLLIAADLVNSAKDKNISKAEDARKRWYKNADDIADFLSRINPYWSKNEWKRLLYEHLRMTEAEAVERLSGQYANDIAVYDEIEDEALKMADYMTMGIQRQFRG